MIPSQVKKKYLHHGENWRIFFGCSGHLLVSFIQEFNCYFACPGTLQFLLDYARIQSRQLNQGANIFLNNPSQIDLILTNQTHMYKFSNAFETGLTEHHKFISTISKSSSFKGTLGIKKCLSYKSFNIDNFKSILNQKLNN